MRRFPEVLSAILLVASLASAQATYVLDNSSPTTTQTYMPSALFPVGGPSAGGPIPLPQWTTVGVPIPPAFTGGEAINGFTGEIYKTDGAQITIDANPRYPGPFFTAPAFPVAGMVTPGTLITGLGWGPNLTPAGSLLMTSPVEFQFRAPFPPYGALTPAIGMTFLLGPITGCDYDPVSNSVWLCDDRANIYNVDLAGLPIGPQPVATVPVPMIAGIAQLTGLAVNRSAHPGGFPAPSCSLQPPGYWILVTNGQFVIDALNPFNPWIPTGLLGPSYGLAYSNDYQTRFGSGAPSNIAAIGLSRPAHNSPGGPGLAIGLFGAFPSQPAVLCYDLCPAPALPVPWGGSIFLNPGTLLTISTATNVGGNAAIPIPPFIPAGVQISCFWLYGHPFNPPFFTSHTDLLEMTIGDL